jgi:hypothetical protein
MAWNDPALRAAGVIGTWTTNISEALSVLDEGAAQVLAGDIKLAGRSIPLELALSRTHPNDRDWVFDRINRARRTGGYVTTEFRILTETGEARWVLVRGVVAPDTDGVMRSRGAYIDTTDNHSSPFFPLNVDRIAQTDPLTEAADRCIDARNAVNRTGHPTLQLLSNMILFEIGRVLAARMNSQYFS